MNPDDILKALAHPVRVNFLNWLRDPETHFPDQENAHEQGIPANRFEKSGLSQSTVSSHLTTLQNAGLIRSRRVGQWVFYERNEDNIKAFIAHLDETI